MVVDAMNVNSSFSEWTSPKFYSNADEFSKWFMKNNLLLRFEKIMRNENANE